MLGTNVKLILLILLGLSFFQPVSPSSDNLAEQAEIAYLNGNYQEAVALYEALLTSVQTGELYFNLGNAYYQLGEEGRALVNYSRATEYIPRDEELRFNLALVRSHRVNFVVDEAGFWESIAKSIRETITIAELAVIIITLWWITCGLLTSIILRFRRQLLPRVSLLVISTIFVFVIILGTIRFAIDSLHPSAIIVSENVQVMSGPGSDYLEIFMLYEADEVRVIERENDWIRFQLPDLREGWIRLAEVEEV